MSTLQDTIFRFMSDAFIAGRAIEPGEVATFLQKTFPDVPHAELADKVARAANGMGVRIKRVNA